MDSAAAIGLDGGRSMSWLLEHPVVTALGVLAFHLAGALHVLHALLFVRTSQGTIAWIVSLVFVPYLAIPLYWFFGRHRFHGYIEARRSGNEDFTRQMGALQRGLSRFEVMPEGPHAGFLEAARRLADLPLVRGNRVELLVNGELTFRSMFEAIDSARHYLLALFFIVKGDRVGTRFKDALIARARAGVRVLFLYDQIGSRKIPRAFVCELQEAGVEVHAFGGNRGWGSRFQINFRNHRKILVADGRVALVGGLNVGDEYLDGHPELGSWRDTHLRLAGPAVDIVQLVFLEDWYWATRQIPELSWSSDPELHDQRVLVLPTGPADPFDGWQLALIEAAATARERLWIASPYFVPDEAVLAALQAAALRGVDVRILLPDRPDHLLVWLSSFSYYPDAIPHGVNLFRFREGFMHQKVALIDTAVAIVGTANLDNRSFRLNFEISVLLPDPQAAARVAAMLAEDFAGSRQVALGEYQERALLFRVACRLARLLAPVQ
jgi:cardiolipin synthase